MGTRDTGPRGICETRVHQRTYVSTVRGGSSSSCGWIVDPVIGGGGGTSSSTTTTTTTANRQSSTSTSSSGGGKAPAAGWHEPRPGTRHAAGRPTKRKATRPPTSESRYLTLLQPLQGPAHVALPTFFCYVGAFPCHLFSPRRLHARSHFPRKQGFIEQQQQHPSFHLTNTVPHNNSNIIYNKDQLALTPSSCLSQNTPARSNESQRQNSVKHGRPRTERR